jgi:hypothetical protein
MYYLVVKFEYEITQQEFLEMAWLRYRASARWKFALAFGALLLAAGIFFYFFADHSIGLILIGGFVFFMSLNTTVTALSFRRVYRRNSRLFGLRTTTIRDAGLFLTVRWVTPKQPGICMKSFAKLKTYFFCIRVRT